MTPKKPTPSQIETAKQTLINAGFINPTNWQLIDIVEYGNNRNPKQIITMTQAKEIAAIMEKNHDCEQGINWDYISICIDMYFKSKN